jgi:lysophospholipase L1-like esterase
MKLLTALMLTLLATLPLRGQNTYYNETRPIDTTAQAPAEVQASPLYGRSLLIIGDSYVRNHRRPIEEAWHYLVAEKYHMRYYNYGKNGNCVAFDRTRRGFGIPMYQRLGELPEAMDYVLVVAGHNDATMIAERDSAMTDAAYAARRDERVAEFRLRLNQLIDSLVTKYPDAKLAFISPWNVDAPGFAEMFTVLRDVCGQHSVPLYDAATQSGIYVRDAAFRRRYFQGPNDTAHLNAAGHKLFMHKAETFLSGL